MSVVQQKIAEESGIWLMKSEPDAYSIDDLKKEKKTLWDGIRNYQARNFMMQHMKVGDTVLFYHSNAKPPGIVGLAKVSRKAVPDPTAFDPKSQYYDPKSSPEEPRWHCVEVKYQKKWRRMISLEELKKNDELASMLVVQRGQRLSIQPVSEDEYQTLQAML